MKERRFSVPAVGGSSLLTIFSVLCLVVFALLSISTVQSQRKLSDAAYEAVEGYYAADAAAEEILARLRGGEFPQGVTREGDTYRYACPISRTQELEVEVRVRGESYIILRWQAVSTADWDSGDGPELWDAAAGLT